MSPRFRDDTANGLRLPRMLRRISAGSGRLTGTFTSDLLLFFCDHASCFAGGSVISDRLRSPTAGLSSDIRTAFVEAGIRSGAAATMLAATSGSADRGGTSSTPAASMTRP